MTCVVGFTDSKQGISWVGADSASFCQNTKTIQSQPKVFRAKQCSQILMGATTSFRGIDLLRYSDSLFTSYGATNPEKIDHEYMVTEFVPKLIALFHDGMVTDTELDRKLDMLVATPRKIFKIQQDFSVLEPSIPIVTLGIGDDISMGSMLTMFHMDFSMTSEDKILTALKVAEEYSLGVEGPFTILSTDGTETVYAKSQ